MYSKPDLIRCGNNLWRFRIAKGLSVNALAELADVSAENITLFESGKGNDTYLIDLLKLAEVLEVDISDILTDH